MKQTCICMTNFFRRKMLSHQSSDLFIFQILTDTHTHVNILIVKEMIRI